MYMYGPRMLQRICFQRDEGGQRCWCVLYTHIWTLFTSYSSYWLHAASISRIIATTSWYTIFWNLGKHQLFKRTNLVGDAFNTFFDFPVMLPPGMVFFYQSTNLTYPWVRQDPRRRHRYSAEDVCGFAVELGDVWLGVKNVWLRRANIARWQSNDSHIDSNKVKHQHSILRESNPFQM